MPCAGGGRVLETQGGVRLGWQENVRPQTRASQLGPDCEGAAHVLCCGPGPGGLQGGAAQSDGFENDHSGHACRSLGPVTREAAAACEKPASSAAARTEGRGGRRGGGTEGRGDRGEGGTEGGTEERGDGGEGGWRRRGQRGGGTERRGDRGEGGQRGGMEERGDRGGDRGEGGRRGGLRGALRGRGGPSPLET